MQLAPALIDAHTTTTAGIRILGLTSIWLAVVIDSFCVVARKSRIFSLRRILAQLYPGSLPGNFILSFSAWRQVKYRLGREADGESVLRAAVAASPQDAALLHALGLALVRLRRLDEALGELPHSEPDPDQARYAYVYAVALHSAGRVGDAKTVLKEGLARHSRQSR
jgi:predicted Zn-dependent protease